MKQFNGYADVEASAKAAGSSAKLPVGAYICKILAVKYEEGTDDNSDRIAIQFDVQEGEYKDFFKKQYEANQNEDKKWKGSTRIYVPTDDGTEKDSWSKKTFANWTTSIEASNPGYSWDWDEKKWKNKLVGIVFGETGTVIEGKDVLYTEARFPVAVERIKNGTAPAAKFKAKKGYPCGNTSSGNANKSDTNSFANIDPNVEEEIPF